MVQLVHACVKPEDFPGMQALADRYPEVFLAVGLHPLDVERRWDEALCNRIREQARSDKRVVAIGETGLDFLKPTIPRSRSGPFATRSPSPNSWTYR